MNCRPGLPANGMTSENASARIRRRIKAAHVLIGNMKLVIQLPAGHRAQTITKVDHLSVYLFC